jgi:predicted nucleic acid-binding protein
MRGKRVYFDANVVIYLIEGFPQLERSLLEIRDSILFAESVIVTSELTLCEALARPFRCEDAALVARYRQFIEGSGAMELRTTTRDVYVRASFYRAGYSLKTPDAIHVATAVDAGCNLFVTGDNRLRTPKGIELFMLR